MGISQRNTQEKKMNSTTTMFHREDKVLGVMSRVSGQKVLRTCSYVFDESPSGICYEVLFKCLSV